MEASHLVSQTCTRYGTAGRQARARPGCPQDVRVPDSKARCRCAPVCCARVEHGWMGWGSWRHGRRGAGPVRSSPPKTVFPGARGSKETVFLLETSSTADATARTGLDGPDGPDNPCGCGPFWSRGEPDFENSIFISVVFGVSLVPSHGSGSAEPQSWGLLGFGFGFGFDLDFDWDLCSICVGPLRD